MSTLEERQRIVKGWKIPFHGCEMLTRIKRKSPANPGKRTNPSELATETAPLDGISHLVISAGRLGNQAH